MKKLLLAWNLFLLLPGLLLAQTPSEKQKATFDLYYAGEKAGYASFIIHEKEKGLLTLLAKTQLKIPQMELLLYETQKMDSTFHPLSYKLDLFVWRKNYTRIEVSFSADSAQMAVTFGLKGKPKLATLPWSKEGLLLDNNLMDHWQLLAFRYDYARGGEQSFTALVPQVGQQLPVKVVLVASEKAELKGGKIRAIHLEAKLATISVDMWVDEKTHDLLKLEIPAQKFRLERASSFVPFSMDEVDTLLKDIRSQEESFLEERYRSEEVEFLSDHVRLAGTLTIPEMPSPSRYPAVLLLAGSGKLDRDGNAAMFRTFFLRQLADTLSRSGFVTLRYDKRGAGRSQGDFGQIDLETLVKDAQAALRYLRMRPEVDSNRVAVVGHSEGGTIGPMICARGGRVAALVIMAGAGRPLDQLIYDQTRYLIELRGGSPEEREAQLAQVKSLIEKVRSGQQKGPTPFGPSGWLRQHLEQDPLAIVKNVRCPVLILNGKKDYQVSAEKDAKALEKALREAGNQDVTLKIYPDLDHLFMRVEGRSTPQLYLDPRRKIAPQVKTDLVKWLRQKLG